MIYTIYIIMIADYTYIGSTRDFKQRKIAHKYNFFNEKRKAHNLRLYQSIRENGGWDFVEIKPIEEYECETSVQARMREQFWVREYNATLNMMRAHRTREEYLKSQRDQANSYYAANREALKQQANSYYTTNREAIKEYHREKIQCDCGATICRSAKTKHLRSKHHADRLAAQQQNLAIQ